MHINSAHLRQSNTDKILSLVLSKGALSRVQISELTGLTPAAVSRITRELISLGRLTEGEEVVNKNRAGRREVMLSIADQHSYVLGVTMTGNRRSFLLASASGRMLVEHDLLDINLEDPTAALAEVSRRLKACLSEHDILLDQIAGIAVSLSITATGSTEHVSSSPLGWENVNVRAQLEQSMGRPVVIEARATSILRAELLRGGQVESAFLINVALGVGSSAYLNRQLVTPSTAGFGGVTHLAIHGDPTECYCGRRGCLEVCGGGRGLLRYFGDQSVDVQAQNNQISTILDAAYRGDKDAKAAIAAASKNMAIGVDHVLSLFEPEKIILTGIVGRHDFYRSTLVDALHQLGRNIDSRRIQTSAIRSSDATLWLALEAFVARDLVATIEPLHLAAS
ncbi:MAG: ROK family transcriptional regulator [Gammaproteobacteria bacterium]|nr:ROK family transcriptional regulator [Gammaproteobacteria bacterium]